MTGQKRRSARSIGAREANAIAAKLGRDLRGTRIRRRLTQAKLGDKVARASGSATSRLNPIAIGRSRAIPMATHVSMDVRPPRKRDTSPPRSSPFGLQ